MEPPRPLPARHRQPAQIAAGADPQAADSDADHFLSAAHAQAATTIPRRRPPQPTPSPPRASIESPLVATPRPPAKMPRRGPRSRGQDANAHAVEFLGHGQAEPEAQSAQRAAPVTGFAQLRDVARFTSTASTPPSCVASDRGPA